ncbi:hypothetical protein NFI96_008017 [Prochilodus magdalenae]|nr:hypothetical protein NFI96_008017 [Prochilodus magdalenae]
MPSSIFYTELTSYLDKGGGAVRVMFFDFSSAFNTIQPLLLRDKLMKMEVDMHLVTWITDYLTGRPQHVRIRDCSSDRVISSTGAPQGTVLSPVLFTLYTSDFKYNSELCHMQNFSDDTAIVGCVHNGQETEYRSLVEDFVEWCTTNHLKLNITKTNEMCIDFRRSRPTQQPISIKGVDVEVVRSYRYLGVHLDERLDWSVNTDTVYKKAQSRLYFLRRLGSETPADVLPVCGGQRPLLCCGVLGRQYQQEGCWTTQQAAPPRPTLTVHPESPVFTGESVTLKCGINPHGGWTYQLYKQIKPSGWAAVHQSEHYTVNRDTLTIRGDAVTDGDQYYCKVKRPDNPSSTQISNTVTLTVQGKLKPELTSSHKGAALIGNPVVLHCKLNQSAGWKFYWSKHTQNPENETETETPSYTISSVSVSDGGQYWCRAGRGDPVYYTHYSDALWINTTDGPVIVESPVHPVPEGDPLTLHCLYHHTKPSNLTAEFYKDGSLLQTQTTGEMTIRTVSKSDEGLYHCKHPERGESPQSWISVRVSSPPPVKYTFGQVVVVVLGVSVAVLFIILLILLWHYKTNKGNQQNNNQTSDQNQRESGGDAADEHSDVTYSQVKIKNKKPRNKSDPADEPSDVTYSQVKIKNKKSRNKNAGAGTMDVHYAEIELKAKRKPKGKREKTGVTDDTVYSELKQSTRKVLVSLLHIGHAQVRYVPVLSVQPKRQQILSGETITLTCTVPGQRVDDWTYCWYRDNTQLLHSDQNYYTITDIRVSQSSKYYCYGSGKRGQGSSDWSNAVTLTVTERPKASLTMVPTGQMFSGETVTLRCDIPGHTDTGWSYSWYKDDDSNRPVHSSGDKTDYSFSAVESDSGTYTCRGERRRDSQRSEISNTVTLTVSENNVILESPVHPVPEGDPLTLRCSYRYTKPSNLTAEFYKDGSLLQTQTPGEMTIRTVSKSDEGLYHCKHPERGESPQSWISVRGVSGVFVSGASFSVLSLLSSLMAASPYLLVSIGLGVKCYRARAQTDEDKNVKASAVESDSGTYTCRGERRRDSQISEISNTVTLTVSARAYAVLRVSPQSWLTEGDSVTLSCKVRGSSAGWTFSWYRDNDGLLSDSSRGAGGSYTLSPAALHHTGVYKCKATRGEKPYYTEYSTPQPLWITDGSMILESPVHPVPEGDPLTLRCLYRYTNSSDLTAEFYKDGSLLQTQTTGEMTIRTVSKSDEGLYHCKLPERGESPQSWISVRAAESAGGLVEVAVGVSVPVLFIILLILLWCYKTNKGNQQNINQTSDQNQRESAGDAAVKPSDVTYSQVKIKNKTSRNKRKDIPEQDSQTETIYSEIISGKPTDAGAGSMDVTYAEIELKTKKKPKRKGVNLSYVIFVSTQYSDHQNAGVTDDTVYSELKQSTYKEEGSLGRVSSDVTGMSRCSTG